MIIIKYSWGIQLDLIAPCHDILGAINRLHRSLSDKMSLEARCKRYAVLLSMARTKGANNQLALIQTSGLEERDLNSLYDKISVANLTSRYMSTIDRYRTTYLGPAFSDVIECLRRIGTPEVKAYLEDPELIMIVDLHRQSLEQPATAIDHG